MRKLIIKLLKERQRTIPELVRELRVPHGNNIRYYLRTTPGIVEVGTTTGPRGVTTKLWGYKE